MRRRASPIRGGYWHAYQSAELADAVVDMHDIVANLELLNLLQRQCYLAATGLVGAQVILMEAVEDLMVGEDAEVLVVVNEACMKSLIYK